jgi:hypothetical protein
MSEFKDFYWAHRDVFRLAIAVGVVLVAQSVFIFWTFRRMAELGHFRERLSRLADGLALLTDTTEAGMETLARELQAMSRKPAARSSNRSAVSKRVVAAVRKGDDLSAIASEEQLSESEVRLHVSVAESRQRDAGLSLR